MTSTPLDPRPGQGVAVGPFQGTMVAVRMQDARNPMPVQGNEAQLHLSVKSPLNRLLSVDALGAQQQSLFRTTHGLPDLKSPPVAERRISLPSRQFPQGAMMLRLRMCESMKNVKVPFDLNFGLNF